MSHSGWSASNYLKTTAGTIPGAVPLTITARYNPSNLSGSHRIALTWFDGSNFFILQTIGANACATVNTQTQTGTTTLSTGTWYSLTATFISATSRRIWVDGVIEGGGINANSVTPTAATAFNIGARDGGAAPAAGSIAEVACWNVELTTEEIEALVTVSPLLIRPSSLCHYFPLIDSGNLDFMAPAATITGSLTKDNDHPRVILPRQRSLIIPKSAGGGGVNEELSGTAINGAATVAGALNARFALSGTAVTGSATVAGALTRSRNLAGSATGTATATGDLVVQYALTGDITGSATVSGELEGGSGPPVAPTQIGPADDRPTRRKRRDRETLEAYYAALQRKANEDAEREKLEALAEAERALEEAETAKKAEAKRAAVRKVFAALDRAALTEKAKAGAREAEQAALQAIAKRQTQEQREAYLDALDQLNVEIEFIGAEIARLYARRREEEQFLLQRWFAA